jgi:hypothetical protein
VTSLRGWRFSSRRGGGGVFFSVGSETWFPFAVGAFSPRGVKLTIPLRVVSRLRMCGTVSQIRYSRFYSLMNERQGQRGIKMGRSHFQNTRISFQYISPFLFVSLLKTVRSILEMLPMSDLVRGNRMWSDSFRDVLQNLRCWRRNINAHCLHVLQVFGAEFKCYLFQVGCVLMFYVCFKNNDKSSNAERHI